ncbi:MAG: GGDEF domain-containing protein [Nitrosomonas sp.]|nr:GGDEF domain-containing protein [Nitrosomonas sp.]MDP1949558.1 GGDEF domain-containing protein [Nitrosomonas sp.]
MSDDLTQRLQFCKTLPSLPAIAVKIIDLANDPDVDINKACEYISLDPALAAKILKTANSPLYKTRRAVDNIRQAINVLGTHAVIVTALSFSLANSLMKQPNQANNTFNSNAFWRRSVASALACRALGEKLGLKNPDDLFLAGLLQDIGILALSALVPEDYGPVFASTIDHDTLVINERAAFGRGHDEIGYALLKQWHLPAYISTSCLVSHEEPASKEMRPAIHACVAVSGHIADYFLCPGERGRIKAVTKAAESWLDLDSSGLVDVIDIMKIGVVTIEDLFEITIHHPSEITGILAEAKELLTIQTLSRVRELEEKSQRDSLTGANNRGHFDAVLQREFDLSTRNATPLTVAMIDLDHFKIINDTHGHVVGDELLIATVRAIHAQIRQDDTLSRYGGEEFALILPGSTSATSRNILSRLKDSVTAISQKLEDNRTVSVTISIGVVTNMNGSTCFESAEDLLKAADLALYAAKHAGRDQIAVWDESLPIT